MLPSDMSTGSRNISSERLFNTPAFGHGLNSLVFVAMPEGGVLLSQVSVLAADGSFQIRHENRKSKYLGYERQGPYRIEQIHGLVLGVFRLGSSGRGP